MNAPDEKLKRLKESLSDLESVVVAFSGGVDSTFLLRVSRDAIGEKVLAATADSPIHPAEEVEHAVKVAESLRVRHVVVPTGELRDVRFTSNSPDRCYHCKKVLFRSLKEVAAAHGILNIVEGSNLDDTEDYRPGALAADELKVRRPLLEAGLTKAEIRAMSKQMGLATWNKPSQPCLASRIPYGSPITPEVLASIDAAETFLRGLGLAQVRVRHYGRMARIEVEPGDIEKVAGETNRLRILDFLKGLGYRHVALDLAGYRMGSLNEGVIS